MVLATAKQTWMSASTNQSQERALHTIIDEDNAISLTGHSSSLKKKEPSASPVIRKERQVSENRQSGNPQVNKETLSRRQVPADRQSGNFQAKEGHYVDKPMRHSQWSINPHPANSAGLFKCTRAEVAKSAQAKHSAKASVVQAKSQSTEAAKKSEAEGIKKLAQLEDQRHQEDCAEEAYLNASVDERDRNEDILATDGLVEANNLTAIDVDGSIHDRKISYQRHIHKDEEDSGIVSDDMDVMDGSTKSPASSKKLIFFPLISTVLKQKSARQGQQRTVELSNLSAPARKKSKGAQHSALEADWREKLAELVTNGCSRRGDPKPQTIPKEIKRGQGTDQTNALESEETVIYKYVQTGAWTKYQWSGNVRCGQEKGPTSPYQEGEKIMPSVPETSRVPHLIMEVGTGPTDSNRRLPQQFYVVPDVSISFFKHLEGGGRQVGCWTHWSHIRQKGGEVEFG
ncbi:hypothetical protein HETIRDRAFT_120768 [Heterobasidion irregulare TC 32-1]|uniref:Uncharacterized protein n=1 Tax=Heterobasidion irregulare (strain TC 32-1) TaxID=747525 RepID=W4K9Q8_HETIT|nr:uncharacterized protein HETIRDRAFT_120768 [Heterobasidion irregulare TC 32-1]ETW82489.1 hypothetical protein HETIRDRAFT_120768 [Heterobasidion irregulare TC 32-1]